MIVFWEDGLQEDMGKEAQDMAVLGIVAEYNPFHNGHLRHLREAAAAVSPSAVLVALSGPVTQRGEVPLLSPWARAECALAAGADAVFSMPVLWTVRDAEHYALGAVSLLASLGADSLAFGAETEDLSLLRQTADLLESSPASFRSALKAFLSEGFGYPAALSRAAGLVLPESEALLRQPNNILAVCYLRAIRRLDVPVTPVLIPRPAGYRAERIDPAAPSASAVREALYRGAWPQALSALPPNSRQAVRSAFLSGSVPDPRVLDALLLNRLRSMSDDEWNSLPDGEDGLSAALRKAASGANSRSQLIALGTTRRHPSARVSRLCACALLGITRSDLAGAALPRSALLLALKKNPLLTARWKELAMPASPARWLESAGTAEQAAWRLWGLCCGLPGSFPWTCRTIVS